MCGALVGALSLSAPGRPGGWSFHLLYNAGRVALAERGMELDWYMQLMIANGAAQIPNMAAESNPATAHLFIINPLHGGAVDGLFTTHPSTANRIAALRAMAGETARGPWG